MDKPKSRRRWFQFSLRTLLVFVLLVSVGMSWLGVKLDRARQQKEAVEAIERLGGWVVYDHEVLKASIPGQQPPPPSPKWLRGLLGEHMLITVVGVCFAEDNACPTGMTDARMEHLKSLPSLELVQIVHSPELTDAGIAHLSGLAKLEYVGLLMCNITDAAMRHLRVLTGLEHLGLEDTLVTDKGLIHLEELANLTDLYLDGTGVTETGVRRLRQALPKCRIHWEPQNTGDPFAPEE